MQFTDRDKLKAVEREIALRKSAYPRFVEKGKLKQEVADREVAVMEAIAQDYRIRLNGSH